MVKSLLASMASSAAAETMLALQGHGASCYAPDWSCLDMNEVKVPSPGLGQALVQIKATSVNPLDIDQVEPSCNSSAIGKILGCQKGTVGTDGAGVVLKTGAFCDLKQGDEVYGNIRAGYAQYATVKCKDVALKPKALSFPDAGALGGVAGTGVQCWQKLGLDGERATNLTVVVTSGQGGTGAMAVQLAKAMGAARVITAASGEGIAYAKSLGADEVVDYHKQDIFADYLADDSVDLVFDNFGANGTADRAMHAIRAGGAILVVFGGNGGTISKHPKDGVRQINFMMESAGTKEFSMVTQLYDEGKLQPITAAVYGFEDVPRAWTDKLAGGFLGKLVIDVTNVTTQTVLV